MMSPLALSGGRPKNALTSALVLPSNADLICEVLILSAGAAIAVICESIKKVVMNRRATFINVFIFRIEKVFAKARQEKKRFFVSWSKESRPPMSGSGLGAWLQCEQLGTLPYQNNL